MEGVGREKASGREMRGKEKRVDAKPRPSAEEWRYMLTRYKRRVIYHK